MASGQSIRIPFDSPAAEMEATAKAARSAEKDVRKLEKALVDAAKVGKVSGTQVDALNSARRKAEGYRERIAAKREEANAEKSAPVHEMQRMTQKLQRVFGDQTFAKLATGKQLGVSDLVHTGLNSQVVSKAVERVVGAKGAAGVARAGGLAATAVLLATKLVGSAEFEKNVDRSARVRADKFLKSKNGEMTQKEYEFIARGSGSDIGNFFSHLMGEDPYKEREKTLRDRAGLLEGMTAREIDTAFAAQKQTGILGANDQAAAVAGRTGRQIQSAVGVEDDNITTPQRGVMIDETGKALTGAQYQARVQKFIEKAHKNWAGAKLPKAMEDAARREAEVGLRINPYTAEQIELGREERERHRVRNLDASQLFDLKHRTDIFETTKSTYLKRVPPNPTD